MLRAFVVVIPSLLASQAAAQTEPRQGEHRAGDPAAEAVVYQARTHYDFDDDVVEGELLSPEGVMIGVGKRAIHPSLIKVREHFVPEMIKSADDS